jgi:hypothetical protein
MLDSYIKELDKNHADKTNTDTTPQEVPQTLVILFKLAAKLNHFITVELLKPETKMYPRSLKAVLVPLIEGIESSDQQLKVLRVGTDTRATVPEGFNKILSRLNRVSVEIANATIYADKEERLSRRELMQIYHDSFPFADLKLALEKHIDSVRALRLKDRMHLTHTDRDNIVQDGKPYVPPANADEAGKVLRQQAELRRKAAGDTVLGKKIDSYKRAYSKLPTSLKGLPFAALRMPIVPDFKDMGLQIEPEKKLKSLGFKVTVLSDAFVVLEDQFLLAFDHKQLEIDTGVRKNKAGNFVVVRKTGPKETLEHNETTDKLLRFLDSINAKSSERYALGSTVFVPNPRNSKLWLAWVVRENQRKGIAQMATTVEAGWGLPLSVLENE